MTVACVGCGVRLVVPDDKAANPRLKLKCPGCSRVFALASGQAAARRTQGAPSPSAGPTPAAGAAVPQQEPLPPPPAAGAEEWRRCANHPEVASLNVCPTCGRGYCNQCGEKVKLAVICPPCQTLCVKALAWVQKQDRLRRRDRSMFADLGMILLFPMTDWLIVVVLSLFCWVFGFGGIFGNLFKLAFLMGATFHTALRVANGAEKLSLPEFRDVGALLRPMFLGVATMLVSYGPMVLAILWLGATMFGALLADFPAEQVPVAYAQDFPFDPPTPPDPTSPSDPRPVPEPDPPKIGFDVLSRLTAGALLVLLGWLWKVFYTPIALLVASFSQSFAETVKPWVGLNTIQRMGGVYWQMFAIYAGLMLARFVLSLPFSFIPILGGLLNTFTSIYAHLATGCAIGLAVDKKAEELGLE